MAAKNLRIVHRNAAIGSTLTASTNATAALTVTNLLNEYKSIPWRSTTGTITGQARAIVIAAFTQPESVTCVTFAYTNMSPNTTLRVRGWIGTTPTSSANASTPSVTSTGATQVFDSGTLVSGTVAPLDQFEWGVSPLGASAYERGSSYVTFWIPKETSRQCTSLTIEIFDYTNTDQYIQASHLILGDYWSPKFNTQYGLRQDFKDFSTNFRNEAGDLLSSKSFYYRTLKFDMNYLTQADRTELHRIIRTVGITGRLFISLFPENTTDADEEGTYQLYGKLTSMPGIEKHIYSMYRSSIEIEEV